MDCWRTFQRLISLLAFYSTTFSKGRLRPEVQPFALLYTVFDRKGPLLYTFNIQMVPLSHVQFRTLQVKALSLKHEQITNPKRFHDFFTAIERFSFECRKVIGFALSTRCDWLKRFAPPFHPIRSKTKANCDALACIFPRFASATCNYFEF